MVKILYISVFLVLAVAYVNGLTDAPNSIAVCVSTKALSLKKALILASVADFIGSIAGGIFSGKVSEKMLDLAQFGDSYDSVAVSLCSTMISVILWSVIAWYFGIPTSESHGLLAGIFGASVAINNGIINININEWINTIFFLFVSLYGGFLSGFITYHFVKKIRLSNVIMKQSQIISGAISAFLHGAQDSQKFVGILYTLNFILFKDNLGRKSNLLINILCAAIISFGTATGGNRIIKSIGEDMVSINSEQGFSADISGLICLFISTIFGIPVSTTHIKTSAVLGAGLNGNANKINKSYIRKLFLAWILTFPVCSLISYLLTEVFA